MNFLKSHSILKLPIFLFLFLSGMVCMAVSAQGAVVRDARLVELEGKFNETRTELRKLTAQVRQMTQPDKPMAERKKYAETILKLRRRLLSIKRQMEKQPDPVFRLVKVIGPTSRNISREGFSIQFRNPEPGYSAKVIRSFSDSNGSWTVTRNLSIGFKLLPKEITAGYPFGFQIEAKLREAYPRGFICTGKQGKYPLRLGLTAVFGNISVQSTQSADSGCDPGAICKEIGGRRVCRIGYLDQDSGVMLRLRYVPLDSKAGRDSNTRFRYKVESFTDGKRTGKEKNPLIRNLSLNWEKFSEEAKPSVFRINVKFSGITNLRGMPELTLVYQTVKGNAPYIKNVPAYHHPGVFRQSPRRNTGIMATVPKLYGWRRDSVRTTAHKQGFNVRFQTGGPAPSRNLAGRVESQSVPPGTEIPWGGTVTVKMYRKSLGLISVPNLRGLSGRDAQARLQEAGLGFSIERARAAPSERHAGMVESQSPPPGARVKRGQKVVVRVFGSYQDTRCYGIQEKLRSVRRDSDRLRLLRQAQQLACRIPNLGRDLARVERAENQRRSCDNFLRSASITNDKNAKLNFYRQAKIMGCRNPGLDGKIANLGREIQRDRQCGNLIRNANAARSTDARLRILRQAQRNRCQAPGLNNAIASLEREVQRQRTCNTLLQRAGRSRTDLEKLNLYKRAKRNGCRATGLDRTIASLENSLRQQRMCNDLINRGNRAKSVHTKLSHYQNAKRRGCRVRGLDNAIANLSRQAQNERKCDLLLRSAAKERNKTRKLGLLRQAKSLRCQSPSLNTAITNLERATQRSRRKPPPPKPTPRSRTGVIVPGKLDDTPVCDCYDRQNGYYAMWLGMCHASIPVKPCKKMKGRTPRY